MLSEALLRKRLGIFTGSENHRLMGGIKKQPVKRDAENFEAMYEALKPIREKGLEKPNVSDLKDKYPFTTGKLKDAAWSALIEDEPTKGMISYAHEKALEEFFYPDPEAQVETRSMAIGNEREGTAVQLLADELGIQFVHTGEDQVHEIRNGLGSTPDGLAVNELTSLFCSGAEAKCFDVEHHAEMWLINNNSQLERLAPKIWWQCMTAIYVFGVDYWYFVIYSPCARPEFSDMGFHYIKVERDNYAIKQLLRRAEIATEIKNTKVAEMLAERERRASRRKVTQQEAIL